MIRRIIYRSTPATPDIRRDLPAILDVSRRNNRELGVTGLMTASGRTYAQLIEGAPDTVGILCETIAEDPRHTDFRIITDEERPRRTVPDWAMMYTDVSTDVMSDADLVTFFTDRATNQPAPNQSADPDPA